MAYVELPFMEDIRSYPFAPLSIDTVKQEQLDAVDELIDDLLVVDSEETDEKENVLKVEPKEVLNPYYQHLYACLTHRVLHPGTQCNFKFMFRYRILEQCLKKWYCVSKIVLTICEKKLFW